MSRGSHRTSVSSSSTSSHSRRRVADADAKMGSNTKCIITVGIILPLFAAVIGIAAWSLTSGSVHSSPQSNSLFHNGHTVYRTQDNSFEERNDDILFGEKLPIGAAVNKDVLGPDIVPDDRDILLPPSDEGAKSTTLERDPLYVVHYVPQKAKEETKETVKPPAATPDVLSKIISASKGHTDKGTPQFVVFAPMPSKDSSGDDDDDDDEYDEDIVIPRKKSKKRKKSRRKDPTEAVQEEFPAPTHVRHRVKTAPRQYDSAEVPQESHHWSHHKGRHGNHHYQHHQEPQEPCCHHQQHTTPPPKQITITVMPASPLGLLRTLLRPKYDLKKKLFFGVQLENGIGFGGQANPPPTTASPHMHGAHQPGGMMYHLG